MVYKLTGGDGPVSKLTGLEHIYVDIINSIDDLLVDGFLTL